MSLYVASKHGISGFVRCLGPLSADPNINVRVVAVAPGIIKTPIWLDSPEKMRMITEDDAWVTPEYVADTMISLVEQDEMEVVSTTPAGTSGSATEDAKEGLRKVRITGGMVVEIGYK